MVRKGQQQELEGQQVTGLPPLRKQTEMNTSVHLTSFPFVQWGPSPGHDDAHVHHGGLYEMPAIVSGN